ncbi:MAG TPA: thioredoxin family protein [Polyangiaceae bacterium]
MRYLRTLGVGVFCLLTACQSSPAAPPVSPSTARGATQSEAKPIAPAAPAPASPTQATAPAASSAHPPAAVPFLHDDFDGALAQAKTEQKLLFVDAWAEWCHTCKSMQAFVFTEPVLAPLADRVLFLALDTDKPENAPFLEQYEVSVWPSFFAIDPGSKRLIGYWPGSASLAELRDFVQQSLDAQEAMGQARLDPKSPVALLIQAKTSQTQGDATRAAALYEQALARAPADWPRRSEALHGRLWSLAQSRQIAACNRFGERHLSQVTGSSLPAFFANIFLSCLEHEPNRQRRAQLREQVIERLSQLLASPEATMSADDREDTWRILSDAYLAAGKRAEAHQARLERLKVLEAAADAAKTPQAKATFDAARADTYLALGRGDAAVQMLQVRMQELPDSYEPAGRLASVQERLGRNEAALATLDVAIARAYGPRRLRYLAQRARLLEKLGRRSEQIETLRAEVAGYESQPGGHANAVQAGDAQARLAKALAAQGSPSSSP